MLKIITIPVTEIAQNARIIFDEETGACVVIDPGGESVKIVDELTRRSLNLEAIWLTHSHFDHIGGVADLLDYKKVPLYGHRVEQFFRSSVVVSVQRFGLSAKGMKNCPEPDVYLEGGETLFLADKTFQVLYTPGHSPGHLCFYEAIQKVVIAGDVLFSGSIGRTDLPGGDYETLILSIRNVLLPLGDDVRVLSGHGPETTIGQERRHNPFLK